MANGKRPEEAWIMADASIPGRRATVVFLNTDRCGQAFVQGTVRDSSVTDPRTGQEWIPVDGPDETVDLLHPMLVVDVAPAHWPEPEAS
jgi:hypothetical protein